MFFEKRKVKRKEAGKEKRREKMRCSLLLYDIPSFHFHAIIM